MPGVATLILPADAAWGSVALEVRSKIMIPPAPAVPEERIIDVVETLRRVGPRAGLLLGSRATRAGALESAGRIATATGAKLFGEVFIARIEGGQGRVPVQRIPYPIDAALAALAEIDVLVLVGAPEPVAFFAYPGKPSRLLPAASRTLQLGQAPEALDDALAEVADRLAAKAPFEARSGPRLDAMPAGDLTDAAISRAVAMALPEDVIVIDEGLTSGRDIFGLLRQAPRHDYLMLTGGAIGFGPGVAAGAALASPGRKVLALQADGSGVYTLQGLWTQARERLDVVTVIYANRAYAVLQQEMRNVGVQDFGVNARRMMQLDDPALDWVALANGMGVEAASVESAEGFHAVLDYALNRPGPFLIEAVMT